MNTLRSSTKDNSSNLEQARSWLVNFYLKMMALIGLPLGALTAYRVVYTGDVEPIMIILALALLLMPVLYLFRGKVSQAVKQASITFLFLLATIVVTLNGGLLSHLTILGPLFALCLMVFYGVPGLQTACAVLGAIVGLATINALSFGHPPAQNLETADSIIYRGLTVAVLIYMFIFSIYGFTKALTRQSEKIDRQAREISARRRETDWAKRDLEILEDTVASLLLTFRFDGQVTFQNKYAEKLLNPGQTSYSFFELLDDEISRDSFTQALRAASENAEDSSYECRVTNSQGKVLILSMACRTRTDTEGKPVDMVCCASDLTEIIEQRDQLSDARHFESLGLACARIAHDFNNLLTVISGNLEFLKTTELDNEQKSMIDDATDAAEDSRKLTQQIGQYSSKQAVNAHFVDTEKFMEKNLSMIKQISPEKVQVVGQWELDSSHCKLDDAMLSSALLNLATNACDAVSEGGLIKIRADLRRHDNRPEADLIINVNDDGCGIAPQNLDKVQEPFFSTKSFNSGIGLGLSSVTRQVDQMGGTLTITSDEGQGTDVTIQLPTILDEESTSTAETI